MDTSTQVRLTGLQDGQARFRMGGLDGRLPMTPQLRESVSEVEVLRLERGSRSGLVTVTELGRDEQVVLRLSGPSGVRTVEGHPRADGDVLALRRLFAAVSFAG